MTTPRHDRVPRAGLLHALLRRAAAQPGLFRVLPAVVRADLGQHGFSDMAQVQALLDARVPRAGRKRARSRLRRRAHCGEHLRPDRRACHRSRPDPAGIAAALAPYRDKRDRLHFVSGDICPLEPFFLPRDFRRRHCHRFAVFCRPDRDGPADEGLAPARRPHGHLLRSRRRPLASRRDVSAGTLIPMPARWPAALRPTSCNIVGGTSPPPTTNTPGARKRSSRHSGPPTRPKRIAFCASARMGEAEGVMAACEAGAHVRHLFLAWA